MTTNVLTSVTQCASFWGNNLESNSLLQKLTRCYNVVKIR